MAALRAIGLLLFIFQAVELLKSNLTTDNFFSLDNIEEVNNTLTEDKDSITSTLVDREPNAGITQINDLHESTNQINVSNFDSTKYNPFTRHYTKGHRFLNNFSDKKDLLKQSTQSFLEQSQYSEEEDRTNQGNSYMKLSRNKKLVPDNIPNVLKYSGTSIYSNSVQINATKSDDETFVSTTDNPIEGDYLEKLQELSTVEGSSVRYTVEDNYSTIVNENEIVTYKPQYLYGTTNIENEVTASMMMEIYSQVNDIDQSYTTTQLPTFPDIFNISIMELTDPQFTTASLSHQEHDTRTLETATFNKSPTTRKSIIKELPINVSDNFSKEKDELEYNMSEILETTTDKMDKFTYLLPERDNITSSWQTKFDFQATDNKFPLNHASGQHETSMVNENQTQILESTTATLNFTSTECNNILCLYKHMTTKPQHGNNSAVRTISESDEQSTLIRPENMTVSPIDKSNAVGSTSTVPSTEKGEQPITKTKLAKVSEPTVETEGTDQYSEKVFLMISWKILTNEELEHHCVTVAFKSADSGDEWLSTYDIKFRHFISDSLKVMKVSGHMVYISPTPINIGGELIVTFAIESHVFGNTTYVSGLNISQYLNEHQTKLQTVLENTIYKIYEGFPDNVKKVSDCNNHGVIHIMLTAFLASIIVITVAILIFAATQYFQWTAYFTPHQRDTDDSTNLTDQLVLSQTGRYKRTENTNQESYALEVLTREEATEQDNRHHNRPSTSHNSVCTLEDL